MNKAICTIVTMSFLVLRPNNCGRKIRLIHTLRCATILLLLSTWCISCATFAATIPAPYELATWRGFSASAVSYTFDDNSPKQFSVAQPMFDARGLHATFFCIVGSSFLRAKHEATRRTRPDPAAARKQLKLLYLSCGNKDSLINISRRPPLLERKGRAAHLECG